MKFLFLLGILAWMTLSQTALNLWALQAPDFSVSAQSTVKGIRLTACPPARNHINIQAPMFLTSRTSSEKIRPILARQDRVEFLVPTQIPGPFEINLFLCDDKKTYCEKHTVPFNP